MFMPRRPLSALIRSLRAVSDPTRPLNAQLVVTRRCNLRCSYCDDPTADSLSASLDDLFQRVDLLAEMGTVSVTLTGGEPLLHPSLDAVVARVVARGMVCTLETNARLITREWIERLNAAGLSQARIAIDTVIDSPRSTKSLQRSTSQLMLLRWHARFAVSVHTVFGVCGAEELEQLADTVADFEFPLVLSPLHDANGSVSPDVVGADPLALWDRVQRRRGRGLLNRLGGDWERQLLLGGASPWRCRAGARFLYVDEHGRVSLCPRHADIPATPLSEYGPAQRRAAFDAVRGCEAICAVAAARRASALDAWRGRPLEPATAPTASATVPDSHTAPTGASPVPHSSASCGGGSLRPSLHCVGAPRRTQGDRLSEKSPAALATARAPLAGGGAR